MMEYYFEPAKKIPVYGKYDVIVAGGGCAGFASALAAARNGANVLIVEQYPFFGGTATARTDDQFGWLSESGCA